MATVERVALDSLQALTRSGAVVSTVDESRVFATSS